MLAVQSMLAGSTPAQASTDISGKVILLAGDCGPENQTLAQGLLQAGATVIWPAMPRWSQGKPEVAFSKGSQLHRPAMDIRKKEDVASLRTYCEQVFNGLDAVVVNFAEHAAGAKLVETPVQDCEGLVAGRMWSQILLARMFIPVLQRRDASSYIFVSDSNAFNPCKAGGLRSAAAAAELALARSLAFEMGGRPYVYSLVVSGAGVGKSHSAYSLCPEDLAEAVALIVKEPAFAKGQVVIEGPWREQLDPSAQAPRYMSCL